jgi:hypothetical protein
MVQDLQEVSSSLKNIDSSIKNLSQGSSVEIANRRNEDEEIDNEHH